MKAVRIHEFGGPEVIHLEDLPTPDIGPGEILIEVHAGSVNPVDYKIRNGGYVDEKTGQPYYTMRITVPESEIARLEGLHLKAGMPVEAFVQTGERSVLSYLMKPLGDQLARAMKER